ncbi:MAG: transport protein involved in the [Pseudobdellovibrio sp.]|jgi:Fe-S cluster assembly protein SufD|nr:transport protein involved in the [Pseudobdellovibrio sp.]
MSWNDNYLQFKNANALESIKANEQRQLSFKRFESQGLPTKKEEAWKFTSLKPFNEITWQPAGEGKALTHEDMLEISKHLPSEFTNYVIVDGHFNQTLSDDGGTLFKIVDAEPADFDENQSSVETHLLNLAQSFLSKKICVRVQKSEVIEKPVQIVFVHAQTAPVYLSERVQVKLEEQSELKLLVTTLNLTAAKASAVNVNLTAECGPRSHLTLIQLQNDGAESYHFSQNQVKAASDSNVTSLVLSLGGKLTRNYYEIQFNGKSANAEVLGLGIGDQEQHIDNYTFIQHLTGENNSVQQYKSILSGNSHSVFRGRVLIAQDAQKANSSQLNNNLLLTRGAQADSIPQLEIYADDVKAGHGSTVGQLNKDEIFYFLSRGINQYEAVRMLSYGFATELLYKIQNPPLQKFLLASLNNKLGRMVQNVQ